MNTSRSCFCRVSLRKLAAFMLLVQLLRACFARPLPPCLSTRWPLDETWGYKHGRVVGETGLVCDWTGVREGSLDMPTCVKGTCGGHKGNDTLPFEIKVMVMSVAQRSSLALAADSALRAADRWRSRHVPPDLTRRAAVVVHFVFWCCSAAVSRHDSLALARFCGTTCSLVCLSSV